ncbi:MAG: hypothetical protein WCX83_05120, partial [Candidatus Cloacimonas sp.]|nr:hypothetical protein [Candidatus Cloacimonadota bacterium]
YHHHKDRQLVSILVPFMVEDIESFQKSIACYPDLQAEIYIVPNRETYHSLTENYSGIVEFSEAFYQPATKRIYVRNINDLKEHSKLRKILLHEYIHYFIEELYQDIPLWFNEGMAVYFSNDLSIDREFRYAKDFLLGNTKPLTEMRYQYPKGQIQWESFYAKSALAVKYLYTNHREEFYQLWKLSQNNSRFGVGFFRAFSMTEHQFSILLEDNLQRRFKIEILLASTGIVWSLLPLVMLIAWVRKKIQNKKTKRGWIEIEPKNFTE